MFDFEDPEKLARLMAAAALFQPQSKLLSRGGQVMNSLSEGLGAYAKGGLLGSQNKRRNEVMAQEAALRKMQLDAANRDVEYNKAFGEQLTGKPEIQYNDTLGSEPPQGNIQDAVAPGFNYQALAKIDGRKAYMDQQAMIAARRKAMHFGKPGEVGMEEQPDGTYVQKFAIPSEQPSAVKELQFSLNAMGIKPGTPQYEEVMRNYLAKTSGGNDKAKLGLDYANFGLGQAKYGLDAAQARDAGVQGVPGIPGLPFGMPGPGVVSTAQSPVRAPVGPTPQPVPQNPVAGPVQGQGMVQEPAPKDVRAANLDLVKNYAQKGADMTMKQYEMAQTAVTALPKIHSVLDILQKGDASTGIGAEIFNNVNRLRSQFLGDIKAGKSVTDTQMLDALLGSDVFPMIQSLGIGARGMDTPAEREYLRKVMTGTIDLDKNALIKLTEIRADINKRAIEKFNARYDKGELQPFFAGMGITPEKFAIPERQSSAPETKTVQVGGKPVEARRAKNGKFYVQIGGRYFEVNE